MKKIVNFRAALFVAAGFMVGIFCALQFVYGKYIWTIAAAVSVAVWAVLDVALRRKVGCAVLLFAIFGVLGFFNLQLAYHRLSARETVSRTVTITGRVCDIGRNGAEADWYYLEDCVDEQGNRLPGRVTVYAVFDEFPDSRLHTGDIVVLQGELNSVYPVGGNVNTSYIRDDLAFELTGVKQCSVRSGSLRLDERIRGYIWSVTSKYMPKNGGIAYALLTGDRNAIASDVIGAFKDAGILHLLAVSGLHVGFIVAILCFVLHRFRLHPAVEGAIVAVPLVFYAYVCAFTPSVVRAVVMTLVGYVARILHGRNDMLTSMSWSALLILAVQPYYLFDVGFQLSFLSVFGIATLYMAFMRLLRRRNVNKFVTAVLGAFALSLCCSCATFFVSAYHFGEVSLVGAFLNVLVIPVVSAVFALLCVGMIPLLHVLFVPAEVALQLIVRVAESVSSTDFATVTVTVLAISVLASIAAMLVLGGYVNISRKLRAVVCSALAAVMVVGFALAYVPYPNGDAVHVFSSDADSMLAVRTAQGESAIVGDFSERSTVLAAIDVLRSRNIYRCSLYICHAGAANEYLVEQALKNLPVDKVYLFTGLVGDDLANMFASYGLPPVVPEHNVPVGENIAVCGIFDGLLRGAAVQLGKINVCIVYGDKAAAADFVKLHGNYSLYCLSEACEAYSQLGLLTVTPYQSAQSGNYGANKYGNFTIRQKSGKIQLSFG